MYVYNLSAQIATAVSGNIYFEHTYRLNEIVLVHFLYSRKSIDHEHFTKLAVDVPFFSCCMTNQHCVLSIFRPVEQTATINLTVVT